MIMKHSPSLNIHFCMPMMMIRWSDGSMNEKDKFVGNDKRYWTFIIDQTIPESTAFKSLTQETEKKSQKKLLTSVFGQN